MSHFTTHSAAILDIKQAHSALIPGSYSCTVRSRLTKETNAVTLPQADLFVEGTAQFASTLPGKFRLLGSRKGTTAAFRRNRDSHIDTEIHNTYSALNAPFVKTTELPEIVKSYRWRIEELRVLGNEDKIELREASKEDFLEVVGSTATASQAFLILLENGNLRAIWQCQDGDHLAVQFRGNRMASYVILREGKFDIIALDEVKRLIRVFDYMKSLGV